MRTMTTLTLALMSASAPVFSGPARTYELGKLKVEVGEPFTIIQSDKGRCWFPSLQQLSEKKLFVSLSMSADEINPGQARGASVYTEDGGSTWGEPAFRTDSRSTWIRLSDGACIWTQYTLDYVDDHTGAFRLGRSRDGVTYELSPGTVDFAPQKINKGEHDTVSMVFCRSIVEALDHSLLATMYWRLAGDTLDRSILVRSTDRGTTWTYYSTIGYDPTVGGEGLNEPCLVRLADNALLCLMRNQSGRPMFLSRSTDDGKTWTAPKRMPDKYASMSVYPDLCLLQSGVLACSAGRPTCQLAFSTDPTGTEWTDPITVFDGPSTCYTAIREVAKDTLLYVHDIVPAGWNVPKPGQFHQVVGRLVRVTR
jgi:hypothetical protein